ncbi:MAG: carbon starvation CstA family protein [Phycisphaerae bacterium]
MTVLLVMAVSLVVLFGFGRVYSSFIARRLGEDPTRLTPAVAKADGRDFVPTPTPVVFAHHFASIAGAGPIIGPVIAIIYGWVPALIWVLLGGVLIGAVHDYLATYMTTREDGSSIATIVHRLVGKGAFVAITILLVVMLALVCAAFLNLSAGALTSMLPFDRLDLSADQTLFRVESGQVVIGGIASMSVVCITAVAPLVGYLYIKKKVSVWICSALAVLICGVSITIGVFLPIALKPLTWQLMLSGYVLVAAGVPVWIFLQSRDFINVHILYVGMVLLLIVLVVAGFRGASTSDPIPQFNVAQGTEALGFFWPTLFIVIACGAVSGFHSLCAGGTTCKQLTNEKATRQIGYYGMLLESFLAVCVIAVFMIGAVKADYITDVHPKLVGLPSSNPNRVLGFAMAVGNAAKLAFGAPIAVGALAGMVLLEGFLVTTLDTAIRLTRYLIEEVWRTLFARYDVFAEPVAEQETAEWGKGAETPAGAGGIPVAPEMADQEPAPPRPKETRGFLRAVLKILRMYWVNSAIAVGLMLAFALTGGQTALWKIFATSNQLLASMVLSIAALWLLRQGKRMWFAFIPAVLMLVTTVTNLFLMLKGFLAKPGENATLLTADIVIILITVYLFAAGIREAVRFLARRAAPAGD